MILVSAAPALAYSMNNPLRFKVQQILSAPADEEKATFSYMLKSRDPGAPMPEGSEDGSYVFSITGNSSLNIGPFNYKRQGVFRYDVSMAVMRDRPGFIYDKRTYMIEVHVNSELDTGVVVLNENGTKAQNIVFANRFEGWPDPLEPDDSAVPPYNKPGGQNDPGSPGHPTGGGYQTGDEMNLSLFRALLALSGISAAALLLYLLKRRAFSN